MKGRNKYDDLATCTGAFFLALLVAAVLVVGLLGLAAVKFMQWLF